MVIKLQHVAMLFIIALGLGALAGKIVTQREYIQREYARKNREIQRPFKPGDFVTDKLLSGYHGIILENKGDKCSVHMVYPTGWDGIVDFYTVELDYDE